MRTTVLMLTVLALCLPASCGDAPPTVNVDEVPVEHVLTIEGKRAEVALAQTEDELRKGLMHIPYLPPDRGMLFIYPKEQDLRFWMKNTLIPLDIAFLDSNGKIINIEAMTPLDETVIPSARPAQYALEMKRGWFEKHDIHPGQIVSNLPDKRK